MSELKTILMRRDGLTAEEADELIEEAREDVQNGCDPEEVLYELGLEPDFIFDLL